MDSNVYSGGNKRVKAITLDFTPPESNACFSSAVSYRDSTLCTDNENNSVNSTEGLWGYFHPHRDAFYVRKPSGI